MYCFDPIFLFCWELLRCPNDLKFWAGLTHQIVYHTKKNWNVLNFSSICFNFFCQHGCRDGFSLLFSLVCISYIMMINDNPIAGMNSAYVQRSHAWAVVDTFPPTGACHWSQRICMNSSAGVIPLHELVSASASPALPGARSMCRARTCIGLDPAYGLVCGIVFLSFCAWNC